MIGKGNMKKERYWHLCQIIKCEKKVTQKLKKKNERLKKLLVKKYLEKNENENL